MHKDNSDIEDNGLAAVKVYEQKAGRSQIQRVSKCGYDLITRRPDTSDERHIEVKATNKEVFTRRWLEQLEQDALQNDSKYYLYLVTQADSCEPKIHVYTAEEVKKRFHHPETKYVYIFPKSDFIGKK